MQAIHLIEQRGLSRRATQFTFRARFRHAAGQYVALQSEIGGTTERRYYSIASPPRPDGAIEICIRHEGAFGRHLLGLRAGEAVECSAPSGKMRLLDSDKAAVYFAAGTGVSPMRAILLAQLEDNPQADATLALGARREDELLYRNEFDALARQHGNFRFLPVLSGDDREWSGSRGRVTDHVEAVLRGRRDVDAYFCGQREMVSDLRAILESAGIPDERQCYER